VAAGQINLPQFYSYIGNDLHSGVSKLMATCAYRSFRSTAWSFRRSSDLVRSVPRCIAGVRRYARRHWGPGRGRCSRARILVWRWWIYRDFSTSSVGCGGSWFNATRELPPVDVPQRHVPCYVQRVYSSTHKALLAMVLLWIWQWWRLIVSFNVCLDDVGVWRRPLISASVGKPRDGSVFFDP
jgi:hypothetical protein